MARVTIYIADNLVDDAWQEWARREGPHAGNKVFSQLVQKALQEYTARPARPERSERGRLETLRAVRAAQDALRDVEQGLIQARPVRRSVRRYPAGRRARSGT